jgi:hypothetical protein
MSAEDEELQQLRETIAELEKFHQAMPEDRQTLEILAVAYGKVGDAAGQVRALGDLAGVLVRQKDWEHARIIAENLRSFADDPAAQAAADQAEAALAASGHGSAPAAAGGGGGARRPGTAGLEGQEAIDVWSSTATSAEADIVWDWKDHKVLPDDVCMELLQILMDNPSHRGAWLVSALGVLEDRHAELSDIAFDAHRKRCKLTPVPVEIMDPQRAVIETLPENYVRIKGVLPFGKIAGELLVAIMNGVDKDLRKEIETLAGMPCHFYLMHPRSWFAISRALYGDETKARG